MEESTNNAIPTDTMPANAIQLTIAIPAYNAAQYIRKGLSSMAGKDDRVEIIVIDDGSTDDTADVVREVIREYGDTGESIRLISKPNGGHGSGINTAIQYARGRFFRVVDADDWIVTENLSPLLDRLEQTDADAVIMGFQTYNMTTGKTVRFPAACKYAGQEVSPEQLMEVFDEISDCCYFHGIFYRTEPYRAHNIRMTEKVFYEDHEYATLPFAYVEKVLILPDLFYVYMIGNANQSVSYRNQVKHLGDIETVIRRTAAYRRETGPLSPAREEYFLRRLKMMLVSYFSTALAKNPNKAAGRRDADRIRVWLLAEEPELFRRVEKKYRVLSLCNRIPIPPAVYMTAYMAIRDRGRYRKFRSLWMN